MGLILNLETATTNCSVCIARGTEILAMREDNAPNYSHSEQLHLFIEECLEEAGLKSTDLEAVAVSKGPGSYTGLRIGVSAAKGLCYALNIPLIAIPTLESMASQSISNKTDYIIPVLDARRMEVYAAIFDESLNEVSPTKAEIIDENSFSNYYENNRVHILGSGAEKIAATLNDPNITYNFNTYPSSKEMVSLANKKYRQKDFEDVAYFEPYYLKDFMLQTKKKQTPQQ
ncbi:tRNA (adenosine(37)-N6)-threonylcarbamoyltransferase complex dimerization subunit type 1 TsaB [Maribacter sp. R77961]|uniref:tRNA (adenosine(37)-N6)-threonylcarbamoyltransferase complex dimerization subunit type 1 TsaB n=1 Tax=Maribacter sp. R77961 TaxID=3093871 RepID=UPI0037CAF667